MNYLKIFWTPVFTGVTTFYETINYNLQNLSTLDIQPTEGLTATREELMSFGKDNPADFKHPRDIRFLDTLPMMVRNKIEKKGNRVR